MGKRITERRQHTRAEVAIKISYTSLDRFFNDYALNISLGGIFIATDKPLPIGTRLKIFFSLPHVPQAITTTGEVVRVSDGSDGELKGMGIRFADLSQQAKEIIDQVVMEKAVAVRT